MAELRLLETEGVPAEGLGPGVRLAHEVGLLAARLSEALSQLLPQPESQLAAQRALLTQLFVGLPPHPRAAEPGCALDRPPPGPLQPLDRLGAALKLAPIEVDLLVLAGAAEEHEALSAIFRALHPRGEPRPTVGLAAQLFCQSVAERLLLRRCLETGAAVTAGALRVLGDGPFFERSLAPAELLWSALHGTDAWPEAVRVQTGPAPSSGLLPWLEGSAAAAGRALASQQPRTVLVTADSEDAALQRAAALAAFVEVPAVRLVTAVPIGPELERAISVHALARGVVPLVRPPAADAPSAPPPPSFVNHPGPVVLCLRHGAGAPRAARPMLCVAAEPVSPLARVTMWRELLPELAEHAPDLAARYALEPTAVTYVATDVRSTAALENRPAAAHDVAQAVRTRSNLSVSAGVKLLRPKARWDDLVVSTSARGQLEEAVGRLLQQPRVLDDWGFLKGRTGSRGVRVLCSGPPGTGKTLAAEVLANALDVDLLAVDISRVVSKWIGETEKNLAEVFDAAERAQAVLFFDEADALFGTRTEVSDAHDRYANLETAYLLSRLERFEGLVVLATNLRQNIDPAFLRRLEFVVDFDEPDFEQRHALWQVHLPRGAPVAADVSFPELAALYPVVGGYIRNAAVAAGFLAAAAGTPITRSHFVRALQREYEKAGRAFPGFPPGLKHTIA